MPRTLAQEILVLLDEPSVKQAPVTIGQLSRRLGVSSALTRLCARQLVAEGVVDAVMLEHAGTTTIQALSRVRPAAVVAAAPKPQATAPLGAAPLGAAPLETAPSEAAPSEAAPSETAPLETAPLEAAPSEAALAEATAPSEAALAEAEPSAPGDSRAFDAEAPDSPVTAPAGP